MVKAIIMAGGEGSRLRPLTCNRPKPMIHVINKPVIEHIIRLLIKNGIKDIIISLYYLPEVVQNYFGDGSEWGVNISYSVEETPLGTAGGVKLAADEYNDTIIVLSGDGLIDFDILKILHFHKEKKSKFTITLKHVDKPVEYGIVATDDNLEIKKFLEKPAWSEVFSDTVNTGMYIVEPEILQKFVPDNEKFDFSKDLFPVLQKNDIPLFGFITDGYWCDIGDIASYSNVHIDILSEIVDLEQTGNKIKKNVRMGKDTEISNEAIIKGPVFIGNFVKIKKGAEISEFSVIGNNCIIEENASIRRSVVMTGTVIGPRSEIRGSIVGKRCVLHKNVSLREGSVISDDCTLETDVTLHTGTRVWPDKTIEQGSILTSDLIWGQTEKKTLFDASGISGTFNVRVTPEFSAKLGSALGAYLGKNAEVVISRDPTSASRLIKRAVTSGLLSMGVNVYDMEIESILINRFTTRFKNASMGIYIKISPLTGLQFIQIKFFDRKGFQLGLREEKKIENIFFRGDYPRKGAFETGDLVYLTHHINAYISSLREYINLVEIKKKNYKITVDCSNGTVSHLLPEVLNLFGCSTTVLRGQIKEITSDIDFETDKKDAINKLIKMAIVNSEIALFLGYHGRELSIIDELGYLLKEDDIIIILSLYYLKYKGVKTISIPVTASDRIEKIIQDNKGKVLRTSCNLRSPDSIDYPYNQNGEIQYPLLDIEYDPIYTFLKILEYISLENLYLYEVIKNIPETFVKKEIIYCSINDKASIMNFLLKNIDQDKIELIDGIKIFEENAWILILPDLIYPKIHLFSEGKSIEDREKILEKYELIIKKNM